MSDWNYFFEKVIVEIDKFSAKSDTTMLFFRGECNGKSTLLPSLYKNPELLQWESNLYREFVSYSAMLHSQDIHLRNSWEILYEMRHHGLPTRLLDWTGNFAVALYFALHGETKDPCIWMLNPFELNKKSVNSSVIVTVGHDLTGYDYKSLFLLHNQEKDGEIVEPFKNPIAIYPIKSNPRMLAQDGFFTVQGTNPQPINRIYRNCVKRINIPPRAIPGAFRFLKLANIHHFTLFPDLDGLCEDLKTKYIPHS
nr:FRG domain-containing protein [uncultured Methanoregula sp.]